MKDFGYDVSDYRDVDPMFGTLEDFRALVARTHELGLRVMIDQVLSHTSDQHPWFRESRSSADNPKADWYVWADANSNHDSTRVATRWGGENPDPRLLRLFAAVQLTQRGSPCIYQGDELGLPEAELRFEDLQDPYGITMWPGYKGRDGCRTPFPWTRDAAQAGFSEAERTWLPMAAPHQVRAVDQQDTDPDSLLNFYRRLLAWRKQQPALVKGDITLLPAHAQILAYERTVPGQQLLCVFNLSDQPATLSLPAQWQQARIETGSGLTGATLHAGHLALVPHGAAILSLPGSPARS